MHTEAVVDVAPIRKQIHDDDELLSFDDIEREGNGYPRKSTLHVWKSTNRHGFREIVLMVGGRPRVRRGKWRAWCDSRVAA